MVQTWSFGTGGNACCALASRAAQAAAGCGWLPPVGLQVSFQVVVLPLASVAVIVRSVSGVAFACAASRGVTLFSEPPPAHALTPRISNAAGTRISTVLFTVSILPGSERVFAGPGRMAA